MSEKNILFFSAIKRQIAKDTKHGRQVIFENITKRYKISFLLRLLEKPQLVLLKTAIIFIIAAVRSGYLFFPNGNQVIFLSWSIAEYTTLSSWLNKLQIPESKLISWKIGSRKLLYFPIFIFKNFFLIRKLVAISYRLSRRRSFLVSARSMEALITTLFFYNNFKNNKPHLVISSESNPHSIALLCLAKTNLVKLTFIAHSPYIDNPQKIFIDLGIFWGQASLKQFQDLQSTIKSYHLVSPAVRLLSKSSDKDHILICLSKTFYHSSLKLLIDQLENNFKGISILIRPHPNSQQTEDSDLKKYYIEKKSIEDCLQNCLFVIAGHSTVHLQAIINEIPSFHSPLVDQEYSLTLPFIRDGLIKGFDTITKANASEIDLSYTRIEKTYVLENYFFKNSNPEQSILNIRHEILSEL